MNATHAARRRRRRQAASLATLTAIWRLTYKDWFDDYGRSSARLTPLRVRFVKRTMR
jgi:hypothetical protein